jgi:hypothetical protein
MPCADVLLYSSRFSAARSSSTFGVKDGRVKGLGCGVNGSRFRVKGLGFRGKGLGQGFRVWD